MNATELIVSSFLKLNRRAERFSKEYIVDTFVDVGPLFTLLSNKDHQILYGRRGTGKTHALNFLADSVEKGGHCVIPIDMRTIGSSGGFYADSNVPLSERGTRLLVDTFHLIHDKIVDYVIENDDVIDLKLVGGKLDALAEAISEVKIIGTEEQESDNTVSDRASDDGKISLSPTSIGGELSKSQEFSKEHRLRSVKKGRSTERIQFASVHTSMREIADILEEREIWVIIDEWSEVPFELQPYLGDLLRRTILPVRNITLKIGAIEQRTSFRISETPQSYIGLEIGADIPSSINLDEYMVFDNDQDKAIKFFSQLLYNHIKQYIDVSGQPVRVLNAEQMVRHGFTQKTAFEEFVRSAEGVPRDAMNIISNAALKQVDAPISVTQVRQAARTWYNRDKERAISSREEAVTLLRWIIDKVIGERSARAFLLQSDVKDPIIEYLFDSRILHIIKQNISANDRPGVRFNAFSIDYGCYIDLVNTVKAPKGLFEVETEDGHKYIQVPANDYRSIRRAVLDLEDFYSAN